MLRPLHLQGVASLLVVQTSLLLCLIQDFKAKAIMYGTMAGGWRALVLEGGERALVFREGRHVAECKVQWPVMDQLRGTELPAHHIG